MVTAVTLPAQAPRRLDTAPGAGGHRPAQLDRLTRTPIDSRTTWSDNRGSATSPMPHS